MHDSCLHFIPGVSNPDQGKCITLELYFTFELSADAKTQHLRSHLIGVIWLYVTLINMSSYLLPIDLNGSVSLNPSFTEGNVTCILPSQSEAVYFYRFHIISLCLLCFHSKYNLS